MRVCAAALVCSMGIRLAASGVFTPLARALCSGEAMSFYLYLQTGRAVRGGRESGQSVPIRFTPARNDATEPEAETQPQPEKPSFSAEDLQWISITKNCDYDPDLEWELTRPLEWDLTGEEPTVLILHSHATESYTPSDGDTYTESAAYRTLDESYNMVSLGALVARRLEAAGIRVIHDTALHDHPSYNDAYANAASSVEAYLEQYPSIRLILDLHRDAADTPTGQMVTQCSIGSETAAQLMMVVGTDDGGLYNPEWEDNLSLALKLQVLLERENPGICRPMNLTYHRYNQHLGDRALLIEIGAAGNHLEEARLAAEALAQAIIALIHGSAY